MDWSLRIAAAAFLLSVIVGVTIGLCMTWGVVIAEQQSRIVYSAALIGVLAGSYIALRDAMARIGTSRSNSP